MKQFIALCIFAIGMLALPDPSLGSCSPPGQSSFVVGHFDIAPAIGFVQETVFVGQPYQLIPQVVTLISTEGGGVEVRMLDLVTQPTYLLLNDKETIDYTNYCNQVFRICSDTQIYTDNKITQHNKIPQHNKLFNHRFARDGLTCRI